jgi:hypothetical protein
MGRFPDHARSWSLENLLFLNHSSSVLQRVKLTEMILDRALWVLVWLVGIVHSQTSNLSIPAITSTLQHAACPPTSDTVIYSCDGCGAIPTCYICSTYNDDEKRQGPTCFPIFQTTTVISVSTTTNYTTK